MLDAMKRVKKKLLLLFKKKNKPSPSPSSIIKKYMILENAPEIAKKYDEETMTNDAYPEQEMDKNIDDDLIVEISTDKQSAFKAINDERYEDFPVYTFSNLGLKRMGRIK